MVSKWKSFNFYRETKTDDKGEGFSAKLWSIDLTGYNERLVTPQQMLQTHHGHLY